MKGRKRCPDCKQWLDPNSEGCYCGWESAFSNLSHEPDHQCAYTLSGKRCPLDGTNNFSTHGGGAWYCLSHYQNLQDPNKCRELMTQAESDFIAIMENRIDWRVALIPEEYQIKKSHIQDLLQSLKVVIKGPF